jgi:hypothetical protein
MKRRMNVFGICLVILLLCACGKNESNKESADAQSDSESVVSTESETKIYNEDEKSTEDIEEVNDEAQVDDIVFSYEVLDNGTISIYRYDSDNSPKEMTIPSEIDGMKVTEIEKLFLNEDSVEKVIIPETVEIIGDETFEFATSVKEIEIQGDIIEIGERAFMGCSNIVKLSFGEKLQKIGGGAFFSCESLKEIHFPQSITAEEWDTYLDLNNCPDDFTIYASETSGFDEVAQNQGVNFVAE